MVRYKKRYFVIEYDRAAHVSKDKCELDLEPLNSKDIDVANAIKHKILELHGDFGRAATTVGDSIEKFAVLFLQNTLKWPIISYFINF